MVIEVTEIIDYSMPHNGCRPLKDVEFNTQKKYSITIDYRLHDQT
jgi:hypothetical protein